MTMKRLVGSHCVQRGNSETEGSKLLGKGRDARGWRGQEEQSANRGHPGQGQTGEGKGEVHRG